jgi:hypothetical protein
MYPMTSGPGAVDPFANFGTYPPFGSAATTLPPMQPAAAGDGVRPNWWNNPQVAAPPAALASGGFWGLMNQIMGAAQQWIGQLGNAVLAQFGGASNPSPAANGTAFQSATLGSNGDPHLSLTGTTLDAFGNPAGSIAATFNDMNGHADLFSTGDFGDGFNVSTIVSQPNAGGVTWNQSASAQMEGGLDDVTLGADGALTVASDGQAIALSAGQSATLAGGATVALGTNGAVTISEQNAAGGSLVTTFADNGTGVDVNAQAANVTLSGDLIAEAQQQPVA